MTYNTNVQHTGLIDVRTTRKPSRLQLALASGGVAGALLLGGLFGFHGSSMTTQTQAASSAGKYHAISAQNKTIPVSYNVSASSYEEVARQAAINAGINPD